MQILNNFFRPRLIIGTLPVTLTNGNTADATQVMSDLNWIVNQVNANCAPLANPTFTGTVSGAAGAFTGNFTVGGTLTGNAAMLSPITNSLGANVALNNTANFFDGPSVAQGTSGTWFAEGTVTLDDTAVGAQFIAKLWDGTTVIAESSETTSAVSELASISLSGYITSPAGNIRISVRDITSTSGNIRYNIVSSKASTITAIRIG